MTAGTLTVAEVAERLRVSQSWVADNAERLGGFDDGNGTLRFDPELVVAALTPRPFRSRPKR
jgi:hypothetical protein